MVSNVPIKKTFIQLSCRQRDEKKTQYVFKKLLVKTIIVFTSIYFDSYCKIPARSSNKSLIVFLLQSSSTC